MKYAVFSTINNFNAWHEAIKIELGIPDGLGTLEYTKPISKEGTESVIAMVDAQISHDGLDLITEEEGIELGYLPSYPIVELPPR